VLQRQKDKLELERMMKLNALEKQKKQAMQELEKAKQIK